MNSDLVDQLGAYRSVLEDAIDEAESIDDVQPSNEGRSSDTPQGRDEPIVISLTDSKPRRRSWKALAGLTAASAFLTAGFILATGDDVGVVDVTDDRRVTDTAVAESPTTEAVGISESTIDTLPGRSSADSVEQRRIDDAAFFRLGVMNQSGQQHLSLSDYARIRDEVCAGAVNQPSELVELSRRWGLAGLVFDEEQSANGLWLAARISCPEVFDDQDFTKGPPFTVSADGLAEQTLTSLPLAQLAFVDVSILDDPQWWRAGDQMVLLGTTTLSPEETVDHFLEAFSIPWTVNEVLGPVEDFSGSRPIWSMDISGDGFTGVVDVTDFGVETFVQLAVIDGVYPLAVRAPDADPAMDGDLDCLGDTEWNLIAEIFAASGPDDPETALEQYLEPLRLRYDLNPVSHVRPGVGSLTVGGREVIVANTTSAPAGGHIVTRVQGCEPYSLG